MRRRTPWLLVAILLFVGAAYVMSLAAAPKPPPPRVSLPRHMDDDARARLQRRRTLPRFVVAPAPSTPAEPDHEPPPLRDPLIASLPGTIKRAAVIVEANALRHSPVGQLMIDCFMANERDDLQKLEREGGLDLLEDVDRVAALDDAFIATGRFADVKWDRIFKESSPSPLNARTTLWESGHGEVTATWNQQMVIVAPDRAAITAVVDRLEGRAPPQTPVIDEHDTYGEIYGVVTPSALSELLARDQPALAQRLGTALDRITLHVDASHDVGIVLDAHGSGGDVDDLGKTVGGALALGRLAAQAQSDKNLATILDYARVVPRDGSGFRTELALPLTFLQEKLRDCAGRKRRAP